VGSRWPAVQAHDVDPHQGILHRRALFEARGEFDASFRIAGDYELLLRELLTDEPLFLPLTVAAMSQGGLSDPVRSSWLTIREMRRAQRENGLRWPRPQWVFAWCRVAARNGLWRLVGESRARSLLDIGRRLMGRPPHWVKTAG
jgi:hypothetical protein